MYDPYADFTKHTLPNGLGVHTVFWENRPWVIMEFVVHSGGREDSPRKSGLAHYTEHVVSKNIPGYTSDKAEEFFELENEKEKQNVEVSFKKEAPAPTTPPPAPTAEEKPADGGETK